MLILLTLTQIDAQIDDAWAAINVHEKSYTVRGRELEFPSLDEFQRHIDWLLKLRQFILVQTEAASGGPLCPIVSYQNSE